MRRQENEQYYRPSVLTATSLDELCMPAAPRTQPAREPKAITGREFAFHHPFEISSSSKSSGTKVLVQAPRDHAAHCFRGFHAPGQFKVNLSGDDGVFLAV